MKFKYIGPLDEVDVTVIGVRKGDVIDVPAAAAGRVFSQEIDDDGNVTSIDMGAGFLAQPDTWEPVVAPVKSAPKKGDD